MKYVIALRNGNELKEVESMRYDDLDEAKKSCRSARSLYATSDYVVLDAETHEVVYPVKINRSELTNFGSVITRDEDLE